MTEYHYRDSEDFVIQADQLTTEEITNHLAELLRAYRMFKDQEEDYDDLETARAMENKANIALDTFRTMFRDRLGQADFLIQETEENILDLVRETVEDIRPSDIECERVVNTLEECSSLIMQLTAQQTQRQGTAVWPYIRKIKLVFSVNIMRFVDITEH